MNGLSAAHRTLALGRWPGSRTSRTGASRLRINDRGPFVAGRILDCSFGAAKLWVRGRRSCRFASSLEEGRERPRRTPPPGEILISRHASGEILDGTFTVQAGAFVNQATPRVSGIVSRRPFPMPTSSSSVTSTGSASGTWHRRRRRGAAPPDSKAGMRLRDEE